MKLQYILIASLVLIGLVVGITLRYIVNTVQSTSMKNQMNASLIHGTLHIVVNDVDGNIKYNITKPMDSPTLWFARLLALSMTNPSGSKITVNDTSGSNITIGVYATSSPASYTFITLGKNLVNGRIHVIFGNSSSPSYSVTKYSVESPVSEVRGDTLVMIGSDNKIHLYLSGSASGISGNITEIGVTYIVDKYDSTLDNYASILIIYDVLSQPISLSPSDTISVTYDITIG